MNNEINELIVDVREQVLYMQELGVDAFDVEVSAMKLQAVAEKPVERAAQVMAVTPDPRPEIPNLRSEISNSPERPAAGSRLASLPTLSDRPKNKFFDKYNPLESAVKERIEEAAVVVPVVVTKPIVEPPSTVLFESSPAMLEPTETIEQIRAEIGPDCTRCKLSTLGRSKVVNSVGNFNADLMFVGEAPGADEDEQGFPFVGRAGKLLTDIMMAIGFNREDVFIGNINRCRPPGNRAPEPDETLACKPFLKREIAVVRPKVIVVLGATAAQNLLETKVPIGKLRGQFHDYLGVKVMPTFHPAYLLRDPHKKREVWDDMKMVRDYLKQ